MLTCLHRFLSAIIYMVFRGIYPLDWWSGIQTGKQPYTLTLFVFNECNMYVFGMWETARISRQCQSIGKTWKLHTARLEPRFKRRWFFNLYFFYGYLIHRILQKPTVLQAGRMVQERTNSILVWICIWVAIAWMEQCIPDSKVHPLSICYVLCYPSRLYTDRNRSIFCFSCQIGDRL